MLVMIDQLFGSKTRVKLLQLFYGNPNRSFYVREITRKVEEQINSVRRELGNLQTIGIITSDTNNNKLYYEVNQKFAFYEPLMMMFGNPALVSTKSKASGKPSPATSNDYSSATDIKSLGNVELAIYTGQFTRDESAGVDVMIVGNVNQNKLDKFISDLEKKEGKELRYSLFSLDDFQYRQNIKDRFISDVLNAKKQVLVDKLQLLG